ncbi:hypothetical protein HGO34_21595 [Agrobacterium vitis]|uniref:Uncharacterized protein n=1 Tax=Agrobacterium vitis TaxID=373 RepID=A0AAE4WCY2_AGRVI|nr:hypothetical protein [Agrobacterium vitis]MCF1500004.1 hypothetical protein [Allorhizobium sp. Av2]MCM2442311.1 hypothetical protein [Agrobacterium vitis]MUZ58721.1 hypothetical protein [Agrobacterium vitis]MVA66356.1 hypothetical protein [Agrobacterium vitis]MVA88393.1 hypothetical protein [Agrobacterium vitis]
MSNNLFSYDTEIYNRNFLNCAQRQSIVMLKRDGVPVDWLFYTTQVSTDRIRDFSLIEQKPKFDFEYDGLTDDDFKVIGVDRKNHYLDSFVEAKPQLLDVIARDGFVLMSCNLIHVPHRPEYYNKRDVLHFQTLTGYNPLEAIWDAVDDNSAAILAYFTFDEAFLEKIYNASLLKGYRSFAITRRSPADIGDDVEVLFQGHRKNRCDSLHLLQDIEGYIVAEPDRLKMLAEAFSLLSGSRICFAQFLRLADVASVWIDLAVEIGREAARIRDAFTMWQVGGKVSVEKIRQRARAIADLEARLSELRSLS